MPRLALLCAIAMTFFAANSLLTRAALASGAIGAIDFALVRLVAGAVTLCGLVLVQRVPVPVFRRRNIPSAFGLTLYMLGFSLAYVALEAGVGALILFTGVQFTMFSGAALKGERVPVLRWLGMALALGGLAVVFLPGAQVPAPTGVGLMLLAALGWGIYSLAGRGSATPLEDTAANFLIGSVVVFAISLAVVSDVPATMPGMGLAILSGAVTSGIGYAIWYSLLPHLKSTRAAVVQLSAPVIALFGGVILLGEPFTLSLALATVLVIGGVLIALRI